MDLGYKVIIPLKYEDYIMNWPLFSVIYSIAATVAIGVLMIAALVTGFNEIPHIQIAIAAGVLISIPAALHFTKKVASITGKENRHRV